MYHKTICQYNMGYGCVKIVQKQVYLLLLQNEYMYGIQTTKVTRVLKMIILHHQIHADLIERACIY